jgi:glycosyltransferase involved in cell wall biosynthesis
MACGNAVIASDLPQVRETFIEREGAILCRPGDSSQLNAGISACLEDDGLTKRLGNASRQIVEEHFDMTRIANEYQKLYRRLTA